MKTVAEFKRKIVKGAKVHTTYHLAFAGRLNGGITYKDEDKGIREISVVQSNSFALKTIKADGTTQDSWCNYPKKDEVIFNGPDSITILDHLDTKMVPCLTYTFINN